MENGHDKAIRLLWDRQPEKALVILEQLPASPDILSDRGVAVFMSGDKDGAMELFKEVVAADPEHGPAMLNLKYISEGVPVAPSKYKVLEDWGEPLSPAPAVSIIMPHYNRTDFIEEAIQSALDQTRIDLDLIIVNDGGTRDCEPIIKRIGSDKIRYLYIEHAGQSVALNAGIAHSRGRYINYLDDDDVIYPDHVEALAGYLDEHPEAKVAFSHAIDAEQMLEGNEWRIVERKVVNRMPFDRDRLLRSNRMTAPLVVMHHRELIDEVGGFNEALMAAKDWELWIRMSAKYPFHRVDRVTSEHRIRPGGKTQITASVQRQRYHDNIIVFLHRITPITTRMPSNSYYEKAMRAFGRWARRSPEFLDMIDLRYLKDKPSKLYPLFYTMGNGFLSEGNPKAAKAAFLTAAAAAPWEVKLYFSWLKAAAGDIIGGKK